MEIAKAGGSFATTGLRTVMLENQGLTVYDIHLVRHMFFSTSLLTTNELIIQGLSTRFDDQVEDEVAVGFDEYITENGIFAVSGFGADLSTEGGAALIPTDNIPYVPAMRVPFAAYIVNPAVASTLNGGIEVYFTRVTVNSREKAFLTSQAGGRVNTM